MMEGGNDKKKEFQPQSRHMVALIKNKETDNTAKDQQNDQLLNNSAVTWLLNKSKLKGPVSIGLIVQKHGPMKKTSRRAEQAVGCFSLGKGCHKACSYKRVPESEFF